ncbi:unnamed protein product, partial [Mesorhabditis belari]|uniref:Uncharacterized protein n=1 Tax=Mesorhabditis belari TaxID=2138241 RepID=A0AAF3FPE8_9BILA
MNGLLLYLIVFQTSKSFRSYSIILASVTLSEFFLGLTAALAMTRLIPIENGIVLQFHGLCRKFTPQFCNDVHTITLHCISYGYSLMPLSFWYRHYVLSNKAPSPKLITFLCFLIYLPAFITMVSDWSSCL